MAKLGFHFKNSMAKSEDGAALIELNKGNVSIQCIRDRSDIEIYFRNDQYPHDLFDYCLK